MLRHAATALLLCASAWLTAADLQGFTEEFPPFNYTENQKQAGLANDILDRITAMSGLSLSRDPLPWPRAVMMNNQTPNSLLYTTVRTSQREKQYRWVGPYDGCDVVLLKLKSSTNVDASSLEDSKRFLIGAVRGAAGSQILTAQGFPAVNIVASSNEENSVRMLYARRFDLTIGMMLPHRYVAKKLGLDPEELTPMLTVQKGGGCYFAFNPKVDPQLFNRFEKAFDELRNSGELRKIQERYIGSK